MSENPGPEPKRAPQLSEKSARHAQLLAGKIVSVVALILVVGGLASLFLGGPAAVANVSTGALGVLLGVIGYALGARRLGFVALVLSVAALFLGVAATQGIVPGIEGTDRSLPRDGAGQ